MDDALRMINSTRGVEIDEASADRIRFHGVVPLRTFEITRDGGGFHVGETTGFQTAGKSGQPTPYARDQAITQEQMMRWLTARLNELRTAA